MFKLKKIVFLSQIGSITLIACNPGAINRIQIYYDNPFTTPYDPNLNSISKNNILNYDQGLEATDPTKCTDGEKCYFQYINDRSFSIYKNVKTSNYPNEQSFGTGWFVDREVGTNNFYIATNVHVANLANKTIVPYNYPNPDPELLNISIGRQALNTNLLNKNSNPLQINSFFPVKNWTNANHTNHNKRILTEVSVTTKNLAQASFEIGYQFKEIQPDYFSLDNNKKTIYPIFKKKIIDPVLERAKLVDKEIKNVLFSAGDVFKFGINKTINDNKFFNDDFGYYDIKINPEVFSSLSSAEKIKKDLNPKSVINSTDIGYIDQATLKVTISNEVLAAQFPYFLNPKKYNQWTFPKFSQKQLPDTKDKNGIQISDSNKLTTIYQAGYPVENLKGNLTYRSKGGPTFRMTKGKIVNFLPNRGIRILDNWKCSISNVSPCFDNLLPMRNNNIILKNNYSTGGGSSGSMVINKKYETVGIYWGHQFNSTNLPSKFISSNLAQPLYWDNLDYKINYKYFDAKKLSKKNKHEFDNLYNELFINNYIKNKSKDILKSYKEINDKTDKGLRFNNIENLKTDLLKFTNNNSITNQTETGSDKTEEQKLNAVSNALKSIFSNGDKKYDKSANYIIDYFEELLNQNFITYLFVGNSKTTDSGSINYKQQLIDLFKTNNIKTYNLNP